ncbi:hypothetical protein KYX84_11980 [Enterococcus lactis]|uniref:Uncharacterized protein n=1 Tax=Enterococcus lactis TaxID=357441 RepID=A0AAW4QM69_9ENTE|nr:hypothetical protein [Enterococcus lactis]
MEAVEVLLVEPTLGVELVSEDSLIEFFVAFPQAEKSSTTPTILRKSLYS